MPPTDPCGAGPCRKCHELHAAIFVSCACPCHTGRVAPAAPLHSLRCDAEWSEYVTFHRDHGHGIGPRECIEGCPLWRPEAPAQPDLEDSDVNPFTERRARDLPRRESVAQPEPERRHCSHQREADLLNADAICLACMSYFDAERWHPIPSAQLGAIAGLHRLLAMCECEKCSKCCADIQTLRRMDSGTEPVDVAALRERLAAVEGALRSAHVRNCYCDIQGPDGSLSDANCAAMRRAALGGGGHAKG